MLKQKLKGFAKDSFLYGIGDGLGRLAGLIMLPILSRAFVPADYGAIDLLTVGYLFLGIAIELNLATGVQKFYYKAKTAPEQKVLVTSASFFLVLGALLVATIAWLLAPHISRLLIDDNSLIPSVRLLAACLPLELLFTHLQLLLRLQRKAIVFSVVNIAQVVLLPIFTYLFVITLHSGITGVFISKLVVMFILTLPLLIYSRALFGTSISAFLYKDLLFFTLPGYPGALIRGIMDILPRYILALFAPLTAVGLFGVAFRITQVLKMFVMAFNRAWNPFAFAHFGAPDEKILYTIIFKIFSCTLILLGLGISLFAKEALQILTPQQYHSAYLLVGGLALFLGIRGLGLIFSTALYSSKQVKWTSYLQGIQLSVFLVMAFLLVPTYQTAGLILALDASSIAFFISYLFVIKKYFPFNMQLGKVLSLLIVSLFLVILCNNMELSILISIIIKTMIMVVFSPLAFVFILNKDERSKAVSWIQTQQVPLVSSIASRFYN